MKFINYILLFFLMYFPTLNAQKSYTLSGTIKEKSSNETLIGVNVIIPALNKGVNTNTYGYYTMSLKEGTYLIDISYLGYKTITQTITLNKDTKLNFSLEEESELIDEIVIKSTPKKINIAKPEMSTHKISIRSIKDMPVVLGEVDVIKSIQLLPGVTNAGEGASGFNVRGGAEDQNLILLDEATLFSSSHLFGFFSIFNADAIKDVKLYKGGIPAQYGGRVSSVLDVHQKNGNSKDFHMSGGIGLISSRLMVEGPIQKNKSSFLIAGRGSYAHLFMKLNKKTKDNSLYFYDLNTKLNFELNDNNKLYFSGYFGRDVVNIGNLFVNSYGNTTFNLRWNHLFSDKVFSNLSVIYSDYSYFLNLDFIGMDWFSGIQNTNIKYDIKHYINDKLKLSYGVNSMLYKFNPGKISPSKSSSIINEEQLQKKQALESALYIQAESNINDNLNISYGLRTSLFNRLGPEEMSLYENDSPVIFNEITGTYESADAIGTVKHGKNESIKTFVGLEPRLAASYKLNDNNSLKASYNRMYQYLHLISNTTSATPLDVWAPSGEYIDPQILDQYAIGYFKNFDNDRYSFEVEAYYKDVKNRIDYIDGADLIAQEHIETVILPGISRSYGLEFSLKKNIGDFSGWISYTLSKSEQRVQGRTPEETGINNGEWYNTAYDKAHDLSVTTSYKLTKKWKFGANFVYQSGRPTTYPNGQYQTTISGNYNDPTSAISVPVYSQRNEFRLPAFHHLDLAATYTPKPNSTKRWKGEWVFSIYNVYGRKNAASIAFRQNYDTGANEAYRTSIFGFVPAFTYNFKF